MSRKEGGMKRKLLNIWQWLKNHAVFFVCILLGCAAGFWGGLCGFIVGIFLEKILNYKKDATKLVDIVKNPFGNKEKINNEPFDGALIMCAIAVNVAGTASNAARQIQFVFKEKIVFDWHLYCGVALKAENKNNDLLTECLAAKLSHSEDKNILPYVFKVFEALEYGWDFRVGNPPSVYLAELLNYQHKSDEVISAYTILGLTPDASEKAVKNAYRQLVRQYHPDTLKGLSDSQKQIAQEAFLRIQKAYDKINSQ